MNHQFVVVWDCLGLEFVGDLTEDQGRRTWAALKGESAQSAIPNLNHLLLRARFNSQRNYEIYVVEAQEGITADDIRDMFEANPQAGADTIRRLGHKVYGNRLNTDKRVIV